MKQRSRPIPNNNAPRQIVVREPAKPQFRFFDFVSLAFLGLMVFFAVQDIAGMSAASTQTNWQSSTNTGNEHTTIYVTSVGTPVINNLVASSTPAAPAEPAVIVVTATFTPTPLPTITPTPTSRPTTDANRGSTSVRTNPTTNGTDQQRSGDTQP